MPTEITRLSTEDLNQQFSADPLQVYRSIADDMEARGVEDTPTMSRALEYASPSEAGEPDAFTRLMRENGIVTRSNPEAGYWASDWKAFLRDKGTRALMTEFFARQWRKVTFASPEQRAVLLSTDGTPGSWQRPYYEAAGARFDQQIAPAIPLMELIGMTTPVNGQDYRSFYLTYSAENLRLFRVGESAEVPIATITSSENTIQLKKYGRGLTATYEQLRRMRVDKLARMIQMMAVQSEVDKVAAALSVMVNGDGNSNAATNYDINGDYGQTAGTLNLNGWLQFNMQFENPYALTHALMNKSIAIQLGLLNTGSANQPLIGLDLGGLNKTVTPINTTADNVRYGWTSDAPANKIVGFDSRFALEYLVEIGGNITEMDRFITNQTQRLVMTEVNGFAIMDKNAAKTLDIST